MNHLTVGILAHVDAGKTTLSESLMYNAGKLKNIGRVDKGDTFLDTDPLEKERGITIFSKQALLSINDTLVTLLDTPGHVDFSAETERTLSVLDAAILVISGPDKVQSHTRTLWQLLKYYNVPTFIFINKMDQESADKNAVMESIKNALSSECIDFSDMVTELSEELKEQIATCDESLLDKYLETGEITQNEIRELFTKRKVFPVFFGSALKNEGVSEFISSIDYIASPYKSSDENFGARVFKISRDAKEERLTHVKITSGSLSVRDIVSDEKITALRVYDGVKFTPVSTAVSGQIVALTGLTGTYPGMGIGNEKDDVNTTLTPVLSYSIILPKDINPSDAIAKLMKLSEEQPDLNVEYDSDSHAVSISLMGEVQTEILKKRIRERFGFDVSFGDKRIIYKETILDTVEGVGHFEPLRHYAEVHLLMEPLPEGEGLIFDADVSEDILDRNWQRLVLTHLKERMHRGVLTGSHITDMKMTLVTGRAHLKHTEGGDFRQATYRAVRNGLMQAKSRLLEPYYSFILEVPSEYTGKAMTDLEIRKAKDFTPEINGDMAVLRGIAPVSTLSGYGSDVTAYTGGLGKLTLSVKGYSICHNEDEVIENIGYEPERDTRNTGDSVFCSHGSGIIVPWNEVKQYMHMPSYLSPTKELTDEQIRMRAKSKAPEISTEFISPEEVDHILKCANSSNKKESFIPHKGINHKTHVVKKEPEETKYRQMNPKDIKPEYLLVDGYNVIFAWDELKDIARTNIDGARGALLDILCDYQAMKGIELIAVFDAYKLSNHPEEYSDYNNIHVVFTRTAKTADYYIERFTKENRNKFKIRVVTSDGLEQVIVRGENTTVSSSREFFDEVRSSQADFRQRHNVL